MAEIRKKLVSPISGKTVFISLSSSSVPETIGTPANNAYENNPMIDALNTAKIEKAKKEVQLATQDTVSIDINDPWVSETVNDQMIKTEEFIHDALELSLTTGLTTRSTSTIEFRKNFVDGTCASLTSMDAIVSQDLSDEMKSLVGYLQSNILTTRNISVVQPKNDVISKIFILPNWDNEQRDMANSAIWSTANFILQGVSEQRAEKYQLIETFGENLVYLYGERPRVYNFNGILINSGDYDWKNEFMKAYDDRLRGTKCVENQCRAYILYEDVVVEGYILNVSHNQQSSDPKVCPFSITMFITNQMVINIKPTPTLSGKDPNKDEAVELIKDYAAISYGNVGTG